MIQQTSPQWDVIVIGGGASGMMAASVAGARGKRVLLIEKNKELGKKLSISGGGRCNITNADFNIHRFLNHYGAAAPFLHSPFSQFSAENTFSYFESRGLPLVIQARNRSFPHTEQASDVVATLKRDLDASGVRANVGWRVTDILKKGSRIVGVETNHGLLCATSYVLATGGSSHPETGSTGDGFRLLTHLGHTIKEPTPTIVPLGVKEQWIKSLAGVSLSFMKIIFFLEDKRQFSVTGKILFTHFGLSGPLILNCASRVAGLLESGRVRAQIDAYPDTDLGALDRIIVNAFNANKNKSLKSVFKYITPQGTADVIITLLDKIDPETKVHSITKEQRKSIVHLLKSLPVTITHLMGYDRAVVADGGVILKEIDTRSMRSRIIENLYVTGDLLHINRPSGGYSLQLCWTTGYVAGNAV